MNEQEIRKQMAAIADLLLQGERAKEEKMVALIEPLLTQFLVDINRIARANERTALATEDLVTALTDEAS